MKPRCSCPRVLAWWAFLKQLQNYFSQAPEKCPEAGRGNSSKWGRGCGGSASGLDPLGALAGKGRRKSGDNVLGRMGDSRNEEVCCPSGKQLTTVASPLSGPGRAEAGAGPLPWDSHQQGSKGGGRAGSGHGVPPPKGKRFPPHICATVDLSEQLVVKEKVIDEDAA